MAHALSEYQLQRETRPATYVLAVTFTGPSGERFKAIGVGESHASALEWARESAPAGVRWLASSWLELYGA
jgi:hypothetical protein